MILANTKATGYSLGLPLFWPEDPTQLSTGIIQGISISLRLPAGSVPSALYIDKYSIQGNHVTMTVNGDGIVCSLDVSLSDTYATFPLQGASDIFLAGWVALYPQNGDRQLNLQGAQINPMYIHASYDESPDFGNFTLVEAPVTSADTSGAWMSGNIAASGIVGSTTVLSAAPLQTLRMVASPEVGLSSAFVSGDLVYTGIPNTAVTRAEPVDSVSIRYINGNPVSGGVYTLKLPDSWVVMGNELCARVGNPSDLPSCTTVDVIQETLGPQNFPDNNPLSVAFPGGALNMAPIYNGTIKFNSEYESGGLVWSQFSTLHDA